MAIEEFQKAQRQELKLIKGFKNYPMKRYGKD